jgi:hypothetical protein
MAEQEREQEQQNPAEIENIEATELDDKDIEEVSGGYLDINGIC